MDRRPAASAHNTGLGEVGGSMREEGTRVAEKATRMIDTVSVFSILEGVVFCLAVFAGVIWLRQRRMRGLYNACKVNRAEGGP